jgi:hypothetical protein
MKTDITRFISIKDVPAELIQAKSKDGKTLVLKDGTKVSDKLIAEAKAKPAPKAATPTPLTVASELLRNPDFVTGVQAIAEEAARKVIEESRKAI